MKCHTTPDHRGSVSLPWLLILVAFAPLHFILLLAEAYFFSSVNYLPWRPLKLVYILPDLQRAFYLLLTLQTLPFSKSPLPLFEIKHGRTGLPGQLLLLHAGWI